MYRATKKQNLGSAKSDKADRNKTFNKGQSQRILVWTTPFRECDIHGMDRNIAQQESIARAQKKKK